MELITEVKALRLENSELKANFLSLKDSYANLEIERVKLSKKCQDEQASLVQFTRSKANLDRMLGEHQSSLNKSGIGYNRNIPARPTTFVKAKGNHRSPTCFFCGKKGHVRETCPYRRRDPHIIRNTFPVHLNERIIQVWVPKGTRLPNMVYPHQESKFVYWSSRKG